MGTCQQSASAGLLQVGIQELYLSSVALDKASGIPPLRLHPGLVKVDPCCG